WTSTKSSGWCVFPVGKIPWPASGRSKRRYENPCSNTNCMPVRSCLRRRIAIFGSTT
ncbi:Type I restriction-modification system, restriction subunit R (EC 3.1.21.3), partial [Methylomonas fluvii]